MKRTVSLRQNVDRIRADGFYKRSVIESPQAPDIRVNGPRMGANLAPTYLGSARPRVVRPTRSAREWGFGMASGRFIAEPNGA